MNNKLKNKLKVVINHTPPVIMFKWIINIFTKDKSKPDLVIEQSIEPEETNLVKIENKVVDPREIILNASRKRLNDLKMYKNFFDIKLVDDIFNQTDVIHEIFNNNDKLTFKKLDQYHYYYTDHLIDLLSKLKTRVDENAGVLKTQLKVVNNKIQTTKKHYENVLTHTNKDVSNIKRQYASYASMQLSCIYNCMLDKFNDFRFKKTHEYIPFNKKQNNEVLNYLIPSDLYIKLTNFDKNNQYNWDGYWIDRTLMGRLQKNLFLITYEFSLMSNSSIIEVFQIEETGDYFMYNPQTYIYQFVDYAEIAKYCKDDNTEFFEIKQSLQDLEKSQISVKAKLDDVINLNITPEIKEVLKKYLVKIEDMELLEQITSINIETQNLQAMLELQKLEI